MTAQSAAPADKAIPQIRDRIGAFKDVLWLTVFIAPILYTSLVGFYAINRPWLLPAVKNELGITSAESAIAKLDALAALYVKIDQLSESLQNIQEALAMYRGDNRAIIQTPGTTYIAHPVLTTDKAIIYNTEFRRTTFGENCQLVASVTIFADEANEVYNGGSTQARPEVGLSPVRVRYEIDLPRRAGMTETPLKPGRVEIRNLLTYSCGGSLIKDEMERVAFQLDAPP